ncbi:hypothetical protein BDK51DRAFT_44962 [Blyttiomyces helicus]|uniref:Uncharacterized protein n=1 Tax=Blyttiomyces helicus TaxID=388810 RepID=A0A4P9WFC0_9FUNG|nr:hypothetical protein BDK51DRAFT_44962 [Blyttiomyces helicus]|eukprot:RKO91324.1 hypothetical protein BDK51DRAFT_44962 [Blyttiomyces helicus]
MVLKVPSAGFGLGTSVPTILGAGVFVIGWASGAPPTKPLQPTPPWDEGGVRWEGVRKEVGDSLVGDGVDLGNDDGKAFRQL